MVFVEIFRGWRYLLLTRSHGGFVLCHSLLDGLRFLTFLLHLEYDNKFEAVQGAGS